MPSDEVTKLHSEFVLPSWLSHEWVTTGFKGKTPMSLRQTSSISVGFATYVD